MKFQKYAQYKDSGILWLGDIPAHWSIQPLSSITTFRGGGTPSRDKPDYWNGSIPWVSPKDMKSERIQSSEEFITAIALSESACSLIEADAVLMVVRSGILKHTIPIAINQVPVALNQDMKALRFIDGACRSEFFCRYVQGFNDQLLLLWSKQGATVESLEHAYVAKSPMVLPPPEEQAQIIRFLDRETSKIDALIAEQERLIELLNEKRQALISHAVTKGLNSDAPMKESGIEWLGKVPKHWNLARIKHIKANEPNAFVDGPFGSNLKSEHFIEGGDVYVIESSFATQAILQPEQLKTISAEHFESIQRSETKGGDIIIAKIGAQFGKCAILPELDKPAVVSGNSLKLTVSTDDCERTFAALWLRYLKERGVMELIVGGSAQPALSLGDMNNLPMLLPPISEQREILQHVAADMDKLDRLIESAKQSSAILQERRCAIISAAVTGKIDVRGISTESAKEAA